MIVEREERGVGRRGGGGSIWEGEERVGRGSKWEREEAYSLVHKSFITEGHKHIAMATGNP